jgi:hypothetical protein
VTTPSPVPSLDSLGDDLSLATARDVRRRSTGRARKVGIGVVALLVIGAGTVVAAGLLSPKQVAAGMPGGAVIFSGTHPKCVANADGSFACSLATAPDGTDAAAIGDYTGTKEVLVVGGKVAGGCIGLDAAGMTWTCYVGQDAVDQEIISQDFLGEPAGPGQG